MRLGNNWITKTETKLKKNRYKITHRATGLFCIFVTVVTIALILLSR